MTARARRDPRVFDRFGVEVFVTMLCLHCRRMRPLSKFGLRKMDDGKIRNCPWCKECRSGSRATVPVRIEERRTA